MISKVNDERIEDSIYKQNQRRSESVARQTSETPTGKDSPSGRIGQKIARRAKAAVHKTQIGDDCTLGFILFLLVLEIAGGDFTNPEDTRFTH